MAAATWAISGASTPRRSPGTASPTRPRSRCHRWPPCGSFRMSELPRERPLGAFPADGTTTFRVWAPRAKELALRLRGEDRALEDAGFGVFELEAEAGHGDNYFYVVDGKELPDPCSRWQPVGLRGPSRVFDPSLIEIR